VGPRASLIDDINGNLFGTTFQGGAAGIFGTVYEIVKTASGYADTPTILVSFNGADGRDPALKPPPVTLTPPTTLVSFCSPPN
jgi:uncharacterized repeat protein (TIGR03803 family)